MIKIDISKKLHGSNGEMNLNINLDIKEGDFVEGTVKNIVDFGIFVDVDGVDGLVHKSDVSWSGLKTPFDAAKIGDKIKVKIKKI